MVLGIFSSRWIGWTGLNMGLFVWFETCYALGRQGGWPLLVSVEQPVRGHPNLPAITVPVSPPPPFPLLLYSGTKSSSFFIFLEHC